MKNNGKKDNPWVDNPTSETQIKYRSSVGELNEKVVFKFINIFAQYIRDKNHPGIYSLFALDIDAILYDLKNNEIVPIKYDRDSCCYSFYGYVTRSYTKYFKTEIEGILKVNENEYEVKLLMFDFGNEDVEKIYGEQANCSARIKLFKNIPVFSQFIMKSNET